MTEENKPLITKKVAQFILAFIFALAGGKIWHYAEQAPFRAICQNAAQQTANQSQYDEARQIYDQCLDSLS